MSLFVSLFARLFYLQIIIKDRFIALADGQHSSAHRIEPRRGGIFDGHMDPLAINLDAPSIYCNSREIADPEGTAGILAGILEIDKDTLFEKLSRDKAFVWIERKVAEEEAAAVVGTGVKGLYIVQESRRNYPSGKLASHVIGFAGTDNTGLEGLELMFDGQLKGVPGERRSLRDARQRTVFYIEKESVPPKNGSDIILTIDSVIQFIAEEELSVMAEKYRPESASVIVMEPDTGRILALAGYPDYDLNDHGRAPKEHIKNTAVADMYEPGSVFKIVTASAVINENAVGLDEEIYCENGVYSVGGRILHDVHKYGKLPFLEVIAKSSNIGTVKAAQKLGKKPLYDYIKRFGFGELTGIGLPGEASGICRPPSKWSKSDMTTIPIGQGIAVTPIQLVSAVSVIANGGYLMTPRIVDKIVNWEGDISNEFRTDVKRRVLNSETCDKMKDIMEAVINDGTGKRARSKKYRLCGKTGTAQMVDPAGGYYADRYNSTFIGFGPKEKPLVSIIVTAKYPKKAHYGGTVAGPVFKNIAERALQYLASNPGTAETEGIQ